MSNIQSLSIKSLDPNWVIDLKCWIWVRLETNADPQQWWYSYELREPIIGCICLLTYFENSVSFRWV